MMPTSRLAEEEFAFRYLSPAPATSQPRPLDMVELRFQFEPGDDDSGRSIDLEPLFRKLVAGQPVEGDMRERLLATLMQVHLPGCVTPLTGYGLHASYPSPRAYYPMQFLLRDGAAECLWHVDMRQLRLRWLRSIPACANPSSGYALRIMTDFGVYAPLYNLFRKSLFALECGHFFSEFMRVGAHAGIGADVGIATDAVELGLRDVAPEHGVAGHEAHRRFARERNSGRFFQGFFPAPSRFCADHLDRLLAAIADATSRAASLFPGAARVKLTAKLCLRQSPGVAPGIYRVVPGGLEQLSAQDPVDTCERLYNYMAFNFRFVPAILFWCVDELAYAGDDKDFLELNVLLGYVNQQLIHVMFDGELLGRPFRSYDQLGIDQLLHNAGDGMRTYYGLMLVRNRCNDALGTLR
jgi:hypothetical protein